MLLADNFTSRAVAMETDYSISERVGLDWVLSEGPRRSHVLPGVRHDLLVEWTQILQFQGGQKASSPSPVYLRGHPFLVKSLPAA